MAAFISSLALLTLAASALALPAHNGTVELSKRTITSPKNAECQGVIFQRSWVQAAAQKAVDHYNAGTAVGQLNSWYPHQYYNREKLTWQAGCNSPWYEFPIMPGGNVYGGGNPLVDRVVIGSISGTNAVLCGVMTHRNAPRPNDFLPCTLS